MAYSRREALLAQAVALFAEPSQAGTRVQVQAALTVANEVARSPHLRSRARSAAAVAAVCEQMLALSVAA